MNEPIIINVTLHPAKNAAFTSKMTSDIGPLSREGVVGLLIDAFADAPPAVTAWIKSRLQHGFDPANPTLWSAYKQHIRDEQQRELDPELSLAAAVRQLMNSKPR